MAAVFAVDTIECLGGSLPKAQQRLVEAWAEIMSHPIHRVTGFSIVGPFTLAVTFGDGTEQRIDFGPILHGALFGPLHDPATFNAVTLDAEAGTLVWPNGADFDPATLHDWPQVRDELAARARDWGTPESNQRRTDMRMEPTRR